MRHVVAPPFDFSVPSDPPGTFLLSVSFLSSSPSLFPFRPICTLVSHRPFCLFGMQFTPFCIGRFLVLFDGFSQVLWSLSSIFNWGELHHSDESGFEFWKMTFEGVLVRFEEWASVKNRIVRKMVLLSMDCSRFHTLLSAR